MSCFFIPFSLLCTPNTPGTVLETTGPLGFLCVCLFSAQQAETTGLGWEMSRYPNLFFKKFVSAYKDNTHF